MNHPNPQKPRASRLLALSAMLLAALLASGTAIGEVVTLNYKEADIREVAKTIGEITEKNFILDPRVKGRVTVTSSRPIPPDAVYETFLSVLQVHGFAAMPSGDSVKIVPSSDARQLPGIEARLDGHSDEIVTRVIELEHVPAAQLVPILRPLVPQHGHLAAVAVEAGCDIDIYRTFEELAPIVPLLSAVKPNGPRHIDEFEAAGGTRALLHQLRSLLHLDAGTVAGPCKNASQQTRDAKEPGRTVPRRPDLEVEPHRLGRPMYTDE
jgi:hypothetical protein